MILRNRAKCLLCGEIVESEHTHDNKTCSCGSLSVDGGHDYIRRSYREEGCFEELSVIKECVAQDEVEREFGFLPLDKVKSDDIELDDED